MIRDARALNEVDILRGNLILLTVFSWGACIHRFKSVDQSIHRAIPTVFGDVRKGGIGAFRRSATALARDI